MNKTVTLDQIEVTASGRIQLRLRKTIMDEGKEIFSEPHRTAFEVNQDIDKQMAAVNEHLSAMGWPAADVIVNDAIKSHAAIAWSKQ